MKKNSHRPINVALYARSATGDGLDTQFARLASMIKDRQRNGENWVVAEKLVEGEKDGKRHGKSAKNTDRPAYQKLLDLGRARLIDVVAVTKLDRISRSLSDFVKLIDELQRYDVKLVSMKEDFDFTTAAGRFQIHMLVALAEYERGLTSARVKDKVLWRLEKGLPIGPPPSGYVMKDKTYAIDEPYAGHVRAANALYLERESADVIVREFARLGYRTRSGSLYSKPVICRMLRNLRYTAKQEHHGQLYDAGWQPIRTWENHEKIQRLMDRNNKRKHGGKTQPRNYVYMLQRLLRCGECGHKMVPQPATGRNGIPYHYYGCNQAEKPVGTVQ